MRTSSIAPKILRRRIKSKILVLVRRREIFANGAFLTRALLKAAQSLAQVPERRYILALQINMGFPDPDPGAKNSSNPANFGSALGSGNPF